MTRGLVLSIAAFGLVWGVFPLPARAQPMAEPSPVVLNFEAGAGLGFSPSGGWTFRPVREADAPQGAVFARLANPDQNAGPTQASKSVPAAPYAGRAVRLKAWLRVSGEATPLAGLWLRIDGSSPGSPPLFFDNMSDRPVAPGDWVESEVVAYVPPNAERLLFGLVKSGGGTLDADNLVLEIAPKNDGAAMPVEVRAYLNEALTALETRHINRASADWSHLRAVAERMASSAQTTAETYPAIRTAIGLLGEKHTLFIGPEGRSVSARGQTVAQPQGLPTGEMMAPTVARLMVPALMTDGAGTTVGSAYQDTLINLIAALERQGACRWIVDLRGDGGGNMWPMVNGLEALLGAGPFGGFGDSDRVRSYWARREDGTITEMTDISSAHHVSGRLSEMPVAVLFGAGTASSGEMTAIAFRGRERTRSFGQASAGYTTANGGHRLPDGARILITTMGVHDGLGSFISGALIPDELLPDEQTLTRALEWLQTEECMATALSSSAN